MFKIVFWKQTAERAAKSAAQALLGLWVGDTAFNAWQANWTLAGGVAAGAVVLSVLTSLASSAIGERGSASAVREVQR